MSFLTRHLRAVNESYWVHARHALYFGINFFCAAVAVTIHAIFPFLFLTRGSDTVRKLYKIMDKRAKIVNLAVRSSKKIAIIGCGASGIISFFSLVKLAKEGEEIAIDIYEKSLFSIGPAYGTTSINHLLNVPASKMSAIAGDDGHFIRWLQERGYEYQGSDFVPRLIYRIYLQDIYVEAAKLAAQKNILARLINCEVKSIEQKNGFFLIEENCYSHCILATSVSLSGDKKNFWYENLSEHLSAPEIYLIGSGLTALDAIISLKNLGYRGKIISCSRSGMITCKHELRNSPVVSSPLQVEDATLPMSKIYKKFANVCRTAENWRDIFVAFRPLTQKFWGVLSAEKKQRFLRHCFRLWNVHRHLCPPSQFAKIEKMIENGEVVFKTYDEKEIPSGKVKINCKGFDFRASAPLINNLLDEGIVELDEIAKGIKSQQKNFQITGALNFGSQFEIVAIPELRQQGLDVAKACF